MELLRVRPGEGRKGTKGLIIDDTMFHCFLIDDHVMIMHEHEDLMLYHWRKQFGASAASSSGSTTSEG